MSYENFRPSEAGRRLEAQLDGGLAVLLEIVAVHRVARRVPNGGARYELPNLRALNFIVHGLLSGGAIATIRFDRQPKALGELLRSRWVDLPMSLLDE